MKNTTKELTIDILLKIAVFFLLLLIGSLLGAVYGFIHDQLTFTISHEYFTKFKFNQFGLTNLPHRVAAGIVGVLATWWMGLFLAIILGLIGFIQRKYHKMFKYSLEAFGITIIVGFITGLAGLLYGFAVLGSKNPVYFTYWYIPDNIVHFKNYIAVGSMHNFSYAGGLLGVIAGIIWQIIRRVKDKPDDAR